MQPRDRGRFPWTPKTETAYEESLCVSEEPIPQLQTIM